MTPEGRLKRDVCEYLKTTGLLWLRLNSGTVKVRGAFMHLCPTGTPDVVIFDGPHTLWAELKAPGQKTLKARAEAQEAFRVRALELGHFHVRAESVEDVARLVKGPFGA